MCEKYVTDRICKLVSFEIYGLFRFGQIEKVTILTKPDSAPEQGVAFVHFLYPKSASTCVEELNKSVPEGMGVSENQVLLFGNYLSSVRCDCRDNCEICDKTKDGWWWAI